MTRRQVRIRVALSSTDVGPTSSVLSTVVTRDLVDDELVVRLPAVGGAAWAVEQSVRRVSVCLSA